MDNATNTAPESGLDKVMKVIKILSQLVWLAIGIITLIATIQIYRLVQSGELMTKIQGLVTGAVSDQVKQSGVGAANGTGGLSPAQLEQLKQIR